MRFFALCLLVILPPGIFAQCRGGSCGGGSCGGGQVVAPVVINSGVSGWRTSDYYLDSIDLYHRGEYVGSLHRDGRWMPAGGGNQSLDLVAKYGFLTAAKPHPQCVCKTGCDCKKCPNDCLAGSRMLGAANFGVQWSGTDKETFRLNGAETTKETALRAFGDPRIPDDSGLLRLTILSNDAGERSKVLADLDHAPELASYKSKLVVHALAPDNWQAQGMGFVSSGHPTIYVQTPDGKVIHRQDDYSDGPAGLANALRKADPNYDPSKDPDLRKPAKPTPGPDQPADPKQPSANGGGINGGAVAGAGLLTLLGLAVVGRKL